MVHDHNTDCGMFADISVKQECVSQFVAVMDVFNYPVNDRCLNNAVDPENVQFSRQFKTFTEYIFHNVSFVSCEDITGKPINGSSQGIQQVLR